MRDVTEQFRDIYLPHTAMVIFKNEENDAKSFVEAYDFNESNKAINRRRLTIEETGRLAKNFNACNELQFDYLISKGLMPTSLLYLHPSYDGFAIWYTKAKKVKLLFDEQLGITSGEAFVPPLVWKATKSQLQLYALKTGRRPTLKTKLYYAPFFNVRGNQTICMGDVKVNMNTVASLEQFVRKWEDYFYHSYFSHAHGIDAPIKGNLVHLWQQQVETAAAFPVQVLKQNGQTINDLIV